MRDAQNLRGDQNSAESKRKAYLERLGKSTDINAETLRLMRERTAARERRSQAWYTAPYRFWQSQVNNRDPYNEARIRDARARSEITTRLNRENELRKTLINNDGGRIPARPESKPVTTFEIEE
jgi:hypothetical protein